MKLGIYYNPETLEMIYIEDILVDNCYRVMNICEITDDTSCESTTIYTKEDLKNFRYLGEGFHEQI